MGYKYYYKDHHLYQYYGMYDNQYFKTREEYLNFCKEKNLVLIETYLKRKNKVALEWELNPPHTRVKTTIARGTTVFDCRNISHFYFEDENDAVAFLDRYGEGSPRWALEALFEGVEGEPDYSPEALSDKVLENIELIPFDTANEFKNIAHYIISYYPNDPVIRAHRKEAHLKQIKSIKAASPFARIYIVAQNYKEEDYLDDPQITYYKHEPLGAMRARNTALNYFYNSNYDFCILSDDDTVVIPDFSAKAFIDELEFNSEKFKNVDIIWGRDMYHRPFQIEEVQQMEELKNYWKLKYTDLNDKPCNLFFISSPTITNITHK